MTSLSGGTDVFFCLCAGVESTKEFWATGGAQLVGGGRGAGEGEGDQFVIGMPGDDCLLWIFGGESELRTC